MFIADVGGGATFPAPFQPTRPNRTPAARHLVGPAVLALAILAAALALAFLRPGDTTVDSPRPAVGTVTLDAVQPTSPGILDGHTDASRMLLTPATQGEN